MVFSSRFRRCLPTGLSGWSHAYTAGIALVAIQVAVGVLFKTAQHNGEYSFSQSGSISISETLKFAISMTLFYREWSKRDALYQVASADDDDDLGSEPKTMQTRGGSFKDFLHACLTEVHPSSMYGFAQLAFMYAILNNVVFVLYRLADPGTIQLIKSGITLVTALVSLVFLKRKITRQQWLAIILQVSGLIVTQYHPGEGAIYPMITYALLCFQTFISAVAGVYNERLNKATGASLHADNLCLYAFGTATNIAIHIVLRFVREGEPAFFEGYDNWGAIMVVLSNVLIGLAITAVYKYADSVIKCFATSISTAILLYISPIIFGTEFGFLILPGTLVVFIATWLYLEGAPPPNGVSTMQRAPSLSTAPQTSFTESLSKKLSAGGIMFRSAWIKQIALGLEAIVTIFIVAVVVAAPSPKKASVEPVVPVVELEDSSDIIQSPFNNTLAFVRWNSKHAERVPLIKKYEPFFHTVHISMPGYTKKNSLEADGSNGWATIQTTIADILDIALKDHPDVEGMLYYHFDAWIDPMGFRDDNFENIWYPTSPDPRFVCHNNDTFKPERSWWGFRDAHNQDIVMKSSKKLIEMNLGYKVDPKEFCQGWSDIYYVPRRFFADYITLARTYSTVFHEVAVPTILHIIDQTYRQDPVSPVLDMLGDCWGNCCKDGAKPKDVLWHRCGHRLNYRDKPIVEAFFGALEERTKLLGTQRTPKHVIAADEYPLNRTILDALDERKKKSEK